MKKNILLSMIITINLNILIAQDCQPALSQLNLPLKNFNIVSNIYNPLVINTKNYDKTTGKNIQKQSKTLIFGNSLWVGGKTEGGEIKTAGNTYVSLTSNYDFYPGPLDENGNTYLDRCAYWDKNFVVTYEDVKKSIDIIYNGDGTINENLCDQLPENILNWPGKGNQNLAPFIPDEMAEFYDANQDGIYNPCKGDLPIVVSDGCHPQTLQELISTYPSTIVLTVQNDNGGPHRLSGGEALKLEIHNYIYNYSGEDFLDNTVFYKYKIINKSTENYENFYAGVWTDSDIGCPYDDYSGTYSEKELVFFYNEDIIDGDMGNFCAAGINTFETNPPILGMTFLRGLRNQNGDDTGLTSSLMTFNCNNNPPDPSFCDPEAYDLQFYNVMTGKKTNGDYHIINGDTIKYMFDGNPSNPDDITMCSLGLSNFDIRNMMSTGGITLNSGQSKEIIGAIFMTDKANLPCPEINILLNEQDKIQMMYDNCMKHLKGVDAPQLSAERENGNINFTISNSLTSNNYNENYKEYIIPAPSSDEKYAYKFEGYKVYQVLDRNMDLALLGDPQYSSLVYQTDISNGISDIYNWTYTYDSQNLKTWEQKIQVQGNDNGINHTFILNYDYILNKPIERNKEYYYVAIAYAYNDFEPFSPTNESGQQNPYLESYNGLKIITVGNSIDDQELAPRITRISGQGNMNDLVITSESMTKILNNTNLDTITYDVNKGPFDVVVLDEDKAKNFTQLRLEINGPWDDDVRNCGYILDSTFVNITNETTGETVISESSLGETSDHFFDEFGILISLGKVEEPGDNLTSRNGSISQKVTYHDPTGTEWLQNMYSVDIPSLEVTFNQHKEFEEIDFVIPFENNLLYPLSTGSYCTTTSKSPCISPAADSKIRIVQEIKELSLKNLTNIDLVLTSNKDLWSKCVVVETATNLYKGISDNANLDNYFRVKSKHTSLDKNGNPIPGETGRSWFPGYAINVETGKRLNIVFGENSVLSEPLLNVKNSIASNDMVWNPSDEDIVGNSNNLDLHRSYFGGHHYVYVSSTTYDECENFRTSLDKNNIHFSDLSSFAWVMAPILSNGTELLTMAEGIIPNDVTISSRVNNSFQQSKIDEKSDDVNKCITNGENPVYIFSINENPNLINDPPTENRGIPWRISTQLNNFSITEVKDDITVHIYYSNGDLKSHFMLKKGEELSNGNNHLGLENGLYIIRIQSKNSNVSRNYKVMVVG